MFFKKRKEKERIDQGEVYSFSFFSFLPPKFILFVSKKKFILFVIYFGKICFVAVNI